MDNGLVSPDVVEQALSRARASGERIGEALVALGVASPDEALRALALQHQLTYL